MKTRALSLCIALLTGVSAWADDVWNYSVYDDCSKNGYKAGYAPAPADVQAVDLGLPSGIKWASCNVGAEKPEDNGNYYAWGEVVPKEEYEWSTYKYGIGEQQLTKYCNDAAYVNWGNGWRMPTDAEWTELRSNCSWTAIRGVGYQATSNINGNSIFFPAAGYIAGTRPTYSDGWCDYLSLMLDVSNPSKVIYFRANTNGGGHATSSYPRYRGMSVRPVCENEGTSANPSKTMLTLTLKKDGCDSLVTTIRCYSGQQIQVTAVAAKKRYFVRWSDGSTDNPRLVTVTDTMTLAAEFGNATSGQCGDNLYWSYKNHTLTISGTGAMNDYYQPWSLFSDTTDAVVLEPGITHIGNYVFNGFVKLGKIELPSTLTSIGAGAFEGCRKLYDIYSYAVEPPVADNTSFANYNVNLYVPCDNLRDYQMDAVFGSFKYIQCMSATDIEQVEEDVTTDHAAQKVFRNGQVYILRESVLYTLTGTEVK